MWKNSFKYCDCQIFSPKINQYCIWDLLNCLLLQFKQIDTFLFILLLINKYISETPVWNANQYAMVYFARKSSGMNIFLKDRHIWLSIVVLQSSAPNFISNFNLGLGLVLVSVNPATHPLNHQPTGKVPFNSLELQT